MCCCKSAKSAICEGNRNTPRLELLSAGAARGNYPEAKPKRAGLKGRPACTNRTINLSRPE